MFRKYHSWLCASTTTVSLLTFISKPHFPILYQGNAFWWMRKFNDNNIVRNMLSVLKATLQSSYKLFDRCLPLAPSYYVRPRILNVKITLQYIRKLETCWRIKPSVSISKWLLRTNDMDIKICIDLQLSLEYFTSYGVMPLKMNVVFLCNETSRTKQVFAVKPWNFQLVSIYLQAKKQTNWLYETLQTAACRNHTPGSLAFVGPGDVLDEWSVLFLLIYFWNFL